MPLVFRLGKDCSLRVVGSAYPAGVMSGSERLGRLAADGAAGARGFRYISATRPIAAASRRVGSIKCELITRS